MINFKITAQDFSKNKFSPHKQHFLHDYTLISSKYESCYLVLNLIKDFGPSNKAYAVLKFNGVVSIEQDFTQPWDSGGKYINDNNVIYINIDTFDYKISLNNGNTIIVKANVIEYEEIPAN